MNDFKRFLTRLGAIAGKRDPKAQGGRSQAKRPRTIDESLARAREVLSGFERDLGADSWLTKKQAEYVRALEMIQSLRVPERGPRASGGV